MAAKLTAKDKKLLTQLSEVSGIHQQRAIAILAITSGSTQAEAAQKSGLTLPQVRYWNNKFIRLGGSCFTEVSTTQSVSAVTKENEVAEDKKAKKEKKHKKDKKDKKDKKHKKDKKSKKKK